MSGRDFRAGPAVFVLPAALALACSKPSAGEREQASREVGPAACGTIAFASEATPGAEGRVRISLLPASGGQPRALELGPASLYPAAVSPDGRTLLVLSSEPRPEAKSRDRFVLVEFGSSGDVVGQPRPIGSEGAALRNPAWSPDGSFVVFESDAHSFRDLYRLDLGAAEPLRLTNDEAGNFEPAVSPDGQRIAFVSSRDGDAELYAMTADGGAPQRLTQSRGDDSQPTWSPDARAIALTSSRDRARGHDVFVLDVEGGAIVPAVRDGSRTEPVLARDLAFSPKGDRLAFTELVSKRGKAAIAIVDLSSGEVLVRTDAPGVDEQPSWSPDGEWLVFARSHDGRSDIARVRADGSELELLTAGDGVHWLPRWIGGACPRVTPPIVPTAGRG